MFNGGAMPAMSSSFSAGLGGGMPAYSSPNYNFMNIYNNFFGQPVCSQPNYNMTNIYNNFLGGSQMGVGGGIFQGAMMPVNYFPMNSLMLRPSVPNISQMIGGGTSMFQGQMFGGGSAMPMFQGQILGGGMPQVAPIVPQVPSFNPFQFLQSLFPPGPLNETVVDVIAKGWGDPHFTVTNSKGEEVTTDHKGTNGNTYSILDAGGGDGFFIDARYGEAPDPNNPQVMEKIRLAAGNDELLFGLDGTAKINGQDIQIGNEYTLADGSKVKYLEDGNIDFISKENDATVHILKSDLCLDVNVEGGSRLSNGHQQLGGVLGTLLENKDQLNKLEGNDKVTDVNGDSKSDDLNGDNFINDDEWARLGYNFDVTATRAIA